LDYHAKQLPNDEQLTFHFHPVLRQSFVLGNSGLHVRFKGLAICVNVVVKRSLIMFVVCGDHISIRWWESALVSAGRYVFPPVGIVKIGAAPRLSCDGPASQMEYIIVARPKKKLFLSWGSLPGWYRMDTVRHGHDHHGVSGAKSVVLMRALVRDYSRPGDLVCDPCAGGGTTLIAAAQEGRRAVGAEMDAATWRLATERIARTCLAPPLPLDAPPAAVQGGLDL